MYPTYEHLHIWLCVQVLYISIYYHYISKQSTLLLFHNILVHVPIIIAYNGTIVYEFGSDRIKIDGDIR